MLTFEGSDKYNNRMKHYQQLNMVHRVHKNVRRMLSEAREVIKSKTKLSSDIKRNFTYLEEISPFSLIHRSAHIPSRHSSDPVERYRKIRAKQRPYSLILENGDSECLGRSDNKSQNKKHVYEQQLARESKQINITSFLNKDEAQLIDSYRQSQKIKRSNNQNQSILPQIIKSKQKRSKTEVSSSYLLTISIDALQKLTDPKLKERLSFDPSKDSNLLPLKESKFKSLKLDPLSLDKVKNKNRNIYIQSCDPWSNQYEQSDLFFQ